MGIFSLSVRISKIEPLVDVTNFDKSFRKLALIRRIYKQAQTDDGNNKPRSHELPSNLQCIYALLQPFTQNKI